MKSNGLRNGFYEWQNNFVPDSDKMRSCINQKCPFVLLIANKKEKIVDGCCSHEADLPFGRGCGYLTCSGCSFSS